MLLGRHPVGRRHVAEWQQLVDAAHRMSGDDLWEHVAQVGLRIDGVHLAGFDERGNDRPMLAAAIGASEEMVFTPEGDRTDGALDHIGVDLDATVVEEASKAVPARERVADRPRDARLAGDGGELGFEPEMQVVDERFCVPLARLAAFIGGAAGVSMAILTIRNPIS